MINGIGETQEFRNEKWNNSTEIERDKYLREMKQWEKDYPFTHAVMCGGEVTEKMINDIIEKPL